MERSLTVESKLFARFTKMASNEKKSPVSALQLFIDDESFQLDAGSDNSQHQVIFHLPAADDVSGGICDLLNSKSVFDTNDMAQTIDFGADAKRDALLFNDSQISQLHDKFLLNDMSSGTERSTFEAHYNDPGKNIDTEVSFSVHNIDDVNFDEGMLAAMQGNCENEIL